MNILLDIVTGPVLLILYIIFILALSDMVEEHIKSKKYVPIAIIFTISVLFSWKLTIGIAVFTGIKMLISWRKKEKAQKANTTHRVNLGSDADYERWKQEHRSQGENT